MDVAICYLVFSLFGRKAEASVPSWKSVLPQSFIHGVELSSVTQYYVLPGITHHVSMRFWRIFQAMPVFSSL